MIRSIPNYLSLIKFSHTVFALPFAMIGFFLGVVNAGRPLEITLLMLVVLCMVFARTSAMAFNRFIDREIDAKNARTSNREIPKGVISPSAALSMTIFSAIAFVATTYFINSLCFYLSPIALSVILGYSLTKRFTMLCHLILGIGLSLAPIGAYLAVTGEFNIVPLLFSFAVIFWVSGFDIIYALQDEDFDKSSNLFSMPAAFGKKKALTISSFLHAIAIGLIAAAGLTYNFHWLYWFGATIFTSLLIYQHTLVKPDDLSKVNIAFGTTNGMASMIFAVFVITDLIIS